MTSLVSLDPRPEKHDVTRTSRASWLRADWVRVAAGFAGITAFAFFAWGVILHELELELPTSHRVAYFVRALTILLTLAVWTAWQMRNEERRLAAARERIREEEIALSHERWRAEQAEGLAAFARVLAHELRNPINAMALHTALVKRASAKLGPGGEPIHGAANVIDAQTRRINELLDEYLAYAKASAMVIAQERLRLDTLAEEAVEMRRDALDERGVYCHVHLREGLPEVRGDRNKLVQAVHHVLENVAETMPGGGRVDIRASFADGHVALTFTDDGPGFEDPEVVFRPFYTTRNAAGLGMAVVRDIVRAHRGEVGAANATPRGARITIRLPAEDA